MLADDLARALDPVWLARDAGIDPDDWQARVLRSSARQIILNCARQSGKSTISAILGLHMAVYTPRSLTLLLARKLDQAKELFLKMKVPFHDMEQPPAEIEQERAIRVELDNGSRIIALPGKAEGLRGFSAVNLLICDEAAYIPDQAYHAVRPMLATSNGRIVIMSTPFGRRGFFHETWVNGGPAWHRELIPATQVPRISPAFLAEERRALGVWYAQEYENAFLDNQFAVFGYDTVMAALSDKVTPLFGVQQHGEIHTRA
jgi:hypothetical protein